MSQAGRCPRCGARRMEDSPSCSQCGWRYPDEPKLVVRAAGQPDPVPVRIDSYPFDRRTAARLSLAAFQVRFLGALGGLLGLIAGIAAGAEIAAAVTDNAFQIILIMGVGAVLGLFLGVWLALYWMAR